VRCYGGMERGFVCRDEHDNGRGVARGDPSSRLHPANARHTNIHQDQVRVQPVGVVDALLAAGRTTDALKPDRGVDQLARDLVEARLVVDDQNPHRSGGGGDSVYRNMLAPAAPCVQGAHTCDRWERTVGGAVQLRSPDPMTTAPQRLPARCGISAGRGIVPCTIVPWWGADRISSWPPTASIRSCMPVIPIPLTLRSD